MKIIAFWKDFLDTLNTPGGHILILLCVIGIFTSLGLHYHYDPAIVVSRDCMAVLLYAMRGDRSANGDAKPKMQRSTDKEQVPQ